MTKLIEGLGYEQIRALVTLADTPDLEGTALCAKVECSWDELFKLSYLGMIDPGFDRVKPNQVHPILTELGHSAVLQARASGLVL